MIVRHTARRPKRFISPIPLPFAVMYDNFQAANGTNLNGRTPPARLVANNWAVPQGIYTINNNRLEASFPVSGQAVSTFDTGSPTGDFKMVFRIPATGSGRVAGFNFRYTSNSDRWSANLAFDNNELRIIETTGGTSTTRKSLAVSPQAGVDYSAQLLLQGDKITFTVVGLGTIDYESSVGNTRTKHGTRANQAVGGAVIIFDEFIILPAPPLSDAVATISGSSLRTSNTHISATVVDNNLIFSGATTQKALAFSNLAGKFHHLNLFLESFGNGTLLGSWNGTSDLVADLPQPDTSAVFNHWQTLETNITPDTWGMFAYRVPYQFTGKTDASGNTVKSTSADYNNDSRRLLTDKREQYIEHTARWSEAWYALSPKNRTVYKGSEGKGFQAVVPVIINGVTIRAAASQSWDPDDYEGTSGRADMGDFASYLVLREGLMLGAQRAGVDWSECKIVVPYPVIAHQGSITENAPNPSGSADAVKTDTLNDSLGSPVDTSDINGATNYPGYPNIAAVRYVHEYARLLAVHNISPTEFDWGLDFGTFDEDGIPVPIIADHDLAYNRVKKIDAWSDKVLTKYGFTPSAIVKRQPEYYAKAQWPMDVAGEHFIEESLKGDYQASIDMAWLIACLEDGVDYPDRWSFWGRGLQSTTVGGSDPNQWYGGLVVRTVTDNNNHAGTAVTGGGARQAALGNIEDVKTYFPPGTTLYSVSFNSPYWKAIASPTHLLVQSLSAQTQTLVVAGTTVVLTFTPYQRQVIAR